MVVEEPKPTPVAPPMVALKQRSSVEVFPAQHLSGLAQRIPARSKHISTLYRLLSSQSSPPTLFLNGPTSTGKTLLTRSFFHHMNQYHSHGLPYAYVNCIEVQYAQRLLFERILRQLKGRAPEDPRPVLVQANVGFHDFLHELKHVCEEEVPCGLADTALFKHAMDPEYVWPMAPAHATRFIILDHAEVLRDMSPLLLSAFTRLGELSGIRVTVILISSIVWEKFRSGTGLFEPFILRFAEYSRKEALTILHQAMPPFTVFLETYGSTSEIQLHPEFNETAYQLLYQGFIDILYTSVCDAIHVITELKYLVRLLFPKYMEPILVGEDPRVPRRLFELIKRPLRNALNKLYLRETSSADFMQKLMANEESVPSNTAADRSITSSSHLDMPHYTKFLLIAAYLASYNPAKFDQRFFAKYTDSKKKKKGGRRTAKGEFQKNQHLFGPKAFPMDRMLAIFYNIIDEPTDSSVDLFLQISSLISTRLLIRMTASLDKSFESGMKCKCNVSYAFIKQVARSIDFDIDKYLQDFA